MKAALLVVDMQQDFFAHQALAGQRDRLVVCTNDLVGVARANQCPVIWVRQAFRADLADAPLEVKRLGLRITIAGTDGARLITGLDVSSADVQVEKTRYSAFFRTGLEDQLASMGCSVLIIAGINTHACIRMTVVDAYQRDMDVIMARECIASHDLAHHDMTWAYLDGKMARGLSNAEIADLLVR
ncbi:cysteine hydrolase [Luteibacter aegosomaticola]|uniref:cysteine hydrolase family protein n=1 Tax=Luteibacter aegosomaticola TaxID=2911538 RepID=UPI001FFBC54C|nr:isochorismatase family cysteine hydrolase [Luteibacter aegosomaticola]UPG91755.1 cysteine hydrolase [Luteibacter aegosomaticola]